MSTRNVIHNAKVASHFRRNEDFGIVKDNFKFDMSAVPTGSAGWSRVSQIFTTQISAPAVPS